MMNALDDIRICISPQQGTITIKEQEGLVTNRKEIDQQSLINCFKNSLRTDEQGFSSGFLPLNCLSIWQGNEGKRLCCGTPSSTMWTKAATGTSLDTAYCWSLTAIKAD